jgi:hypothetical protein
MEAALPENKTGQRTSAINWNCEDLGMIRKYAQVFSTWEKDSNTSYVLEIVEVVQMTAQEAVEEGPHQFWGEEEEERSAAGLLEVLAGFVPHRLTQQEGVKRLERLFSVVSDRRRRRRRRARPSRLALPTSQ